MFLLNVYCLGNFLLLFCAVGTPRLLSPYVFALLVTLNCCFCTLANLPYLFFMACGASVDGELNNFLRLSHAVPCILNCFSDSEKLCDSLHESFIQNISNCEYFEIDCRLVNGNSDDVLILIHVNMRSLEKFF